MLAERLQKNSKKNSNISFIYIYKKNLLKKRYQTSPANIIKGLQVL